MIAMITIALNVLTVRLISSLTSLRAATASSAG
jgi:hypothetical protein